MSGTIEQHNLFLDFRLGTEYREVFASSPFASSLHLPGRVCLNSATQKHVAYWMFAALFILAWRRYIGSPQQSLSSRKEGQQSDASAAGRVMTFAATQVGFRSSPPA